MQHPGFDPVCIKNIYDVYIVINHGMELKGKSPPSICLFYVSAIKIIVDGKS